MKYRRDISSTLTWLAVALILFVGYQVWLRPAFQASPQIAPEPAVSLPSLPPPALFEGQTFPVWDVPPSRLVELGSAPQLTLGSIRDNLDRGRYKEVDRHLKTLSRNSITNATTRRYIAGLWNNLGVQQEKFGGTALSVSAFKQAVGWDPKSPQAYLNLTQAYWERRDPAMVPQFLNTVIRLAPQDPFPHLALADLLLSEGNITLAKEHLDQARTRAERDPNHASYLQRLTAKIGAAEPVRTAAGEKVLAPPMTPSDSARPTTPLVTPSPQPVSRPAGQTGSMNARPPQPLAETSGQHRFAHFTVQFDGPPDQATWTRMRAMLDYAYDELTQKFGHVPAKPITVILHTARKFNGSADNPAWADTLFDRSSGAIHLPTQGALEDLALFSRIVRHEFAHALIQEKMSAHQHNLPTWLAEGLALYLTEDPWPDLEDITQKSPTLIPLPTLQGLWDQIPKDTLTVAYFESALASQQLLDQYNMYGVRQVMNGLQTGLSLDAAMQQKLSVPYPEFVRRWEARALNAGFQKQ